MRIGEVSVRTGVSARMLRHYEDLGLITPSARSSTGYRNYSDDDLRRIIHIESLRSLGLSLKEIGRALDDPGFSFASVINRMVIDSRERLRHEKQLYDRLTAVRRAGATDWDEALAVVAMLRGLRSRDPAQRQLSALSPDSGAQPRLLARMALGEENINVAGALSWAVLQAGGRALDEVAGEVEAGDVAVRRRAVRILAGASDMVEPLHRALTDQDDEVRTIAALALGERGHPVAVDELIAMILTGRRDVDAAEVLAGRQDWQAGVLARLSTHLEILPEADPARALITQALAEFEDSDELLIGLSTDPSPQVAMTARAILVDRRSTAQ